MIHRGIFIVLLVLVGVSYQGAVKVTVFYESLCPASTHFITQQLVPTWMTLGLAYMKIEFVPYGKVIDLPTPGGGTYLICQHGAQECLGNKLQACGLATLGMSTRRKTEFINCVMSSADPKSSAWMCTKDMTRNISEAILDCFNGVKGDELLAQHGATTRGAVPEISLQPNKGSLPQVTFNGVYSAEDETAAFSDLKSVICSKVLRRSRERCKARPEFIPPRC